MRGWSIVSSHRGHDPDAYEDSRGSNSDWSGMRDCPYCGIRNVLLPNHLPNCPEAGGDQK